MSGKAGWLALMLLIDLASPACAGAAATNPDRLSGAKTLFFDGKYAESRALWEQVRAAGGADAETARFWIARCSEKAGEPERALREYGEYLAQKPADPAFVEEARTSRVSLAAQLYKQGRTQYLDVLQQALGDPRTTVRYYAALQLGGLGPGVGDGAIPVLKAIVEHEKDADLVDRARLVLLRLSALSSPDAAPPRFRPDGSRREAQMLKIRIAKKAGAEPTVSINVPVALADLVFKSLPDEARAELRHKGYDAENFWQRVKALGPTQIIDIVGDDGERIQIWLE